MGILDRKQDHIDLSLLPDAGYRTAVGFEQFGFVHNALPELDLDEIDTGVSWLGRRFPFPLMVSSMTGGQSGSTDLNASIAEVCEAHDLPFGVGSQRVMLDHPETAHTFAIVRSKAPNAFIASNIGGAQLVQGLSVEQIRRLIDVIAADALIIHLNPLQELVQAEGDTRFKGILRGIESLVKNAGVPVIVKETGAGLSADAARRLLEAGVGTLDVAGAGGTSWSRIEQLRRDPRKERDFLSDWGIPTARCLMDLRPLRESHAFTMIASGGIRHPGDMLKAFCLGADLCAMAKPVIAALIEGGVDRLHQEIEDWKQGVRRGMLLLGASSLTGLSPKNLYLQGRYEDPSHV